MTIRTVNGLYKLVIKLAKVRTRHGYGYAFFENNDRELSIDVHTSDSYYLVNKNKNEYGISQWMYGQLVEKWILE